MTTTQPDTETPGTFSRYAYARTAPRPSRAAPACKSCGKTGLILVAEGRSWVLCDGPTKMHRCTPINNNDGSDLV